jgi:hypothetical protein
MPKGQLLHLIAVHLPAQVAVIVYAFYHYPVYAFGIGIKIIKRCFTVLPGQHIRFPVYARAQIKHAAVFIGRGIFWRV